MDDIIQKYPAPKSGTNSMAQQYGKQYCKDICSRYSSGRPIGKVYLTHYRCNWCGVYLLHDKCTIVKGTPRCPCCKRRVKTKTAKRKYNTVVKVG